MAGAIARNAPLTVRAAKAMVYRVAGMSWKDALDDGTSCSNPCTSATTPRRAPRVSRETRAALEGTVTAALRIANCSGFYGDRFSAAREMLEGGRSTSSPATIWPS